jgi:threonine/homoserine/homoserine lactone efflux protein
MLRVSVGFLLTTLVVVVSPGTGVLYTLAAGGDDAGAASAGEPKLSIFFFAFLPQFVSAGDAHRLLHMLELSSVFMLVTFVVFVGYGLAAAWVRRHVISRPRVLVWMRRTIASAFVGLGAKLAFAER